MNDVTIAIAFDVVMLNHEAVENNKEYWISAGTEYSNETEIYICQKKFTAKLDEVDTFGVNQVIEPLTATQSLLSLHDFLQFNISGTAALYPGYISVFQLHMYLPGVASKVTVDIFSPLNDTTLVSMCQIALSSTGRGFACRPRSMWNMKNVLKKQHHFHKGYYNARVELDTMLNSCQ